MELCQRNMLQHIQAQPNGHLTDTEAGMWTHQLCLGLNEVHRCGFLHRDIKPDNLLLGFDGCLRIVDFGWCAAIEDAPSQMAGTFHYMAPEVLDQKEVQTAAVDIWSAAVTMVELCTGRVLLTTNLGCGATGLSTTDPHEANQCRVRWLLAEIHQKFPMDARASPLHMSASSWDLLRRMTMPDSCKRATVNECLNHPWLSNASGRRHCRGATPASEREIVGVRQCMTDPAVPLDACTFADRVAQHSGPSLSAPDSPCTISTDSGKTLLGEEQLQALYDGMETNECKMPPCSSSISLPLPSTPRFRRGSANSTRPLQKHSRTCEPTENCIPELNPLCMGPCAEDPQPTFTRPLRSCSLMRSRPKVPSSVPSSVSYCRDVGIDMLSRTVPSLMPVTQHAPSFVQTNLQMQVPRNVNPPNIQPSFGLWTPSPAIVGLGASLPCSLIGRPPPSLRTPSTPCRNPRMYDFPGWVPASHLLIAS
jgi:serine/threonine protein kinase